MSVSAFEIQEDRIDRIVFRDSVSNWDSRTCNGKTWFSPNAVRSYNIALPPGTAMPQIAIQDLHTEILPHGLATTAECADSSLHSLPAPSMSVDISPSVVRDGLRRVLITIPLLENQNGTIQKRSSFQVRISWPTTSVPSTHTTLGKRALSQVKNPIGARLFATKQTQHALRRASSNMPQGIEWLMHIPIGDRDLATQSEDGMYMLTFAQMKRMLSSTQLAGRLDGIALNRLTIAAGNADTLNDFPATTQPQLGPLFQQPVFVLDHTSANDARPDSIWDDGDTIVFYGSGTSLWKRIDLNDSAHKVAGLDYYFSTSTFSFTRDFYVGVLPLGSTAPRLQTLPTRSGGTSNNQLLRYVRAEKDLLLRDEYYGRLSTGYEENSGNEWFWSWIEDTLSAISISSNELTTPPVATLPGLVSGQKAFVSVGFFPHRSTKDAVTLSSNPLNIRFQGLQFQLSVNGTTASATGTRQASNQFVLTTSDLKNSGNTYSLSIGPNTVPNSNQADRFDGFSIAYPFNLQWLDSNSALLPGALTGLQSFSVSNTPSDLRVLKLSAQQPVGIIPNTAGTFTDSLDPNIDIRYHLFRWGSWKSIADTCLKPWLPLPSGAIQDLANQQGNYDYVIITPREWANEAISLANFRSDGSTKNTWRTAVVDLQSIYQQFGSGMMSPMAIRDFLRYARSSWQDLRFVLLVGAGDADYRRLRPAVNEEILPPYEKEDMSSDDYYALLDSGEALFYGSYDRDLDVGRIPANTAGDLSNYITKVSVYEGLNKADNGNWRNTLLLAADDAMQGSVIDQIPDHTKQMETMAHDIESLSLQKGFQVDQQKLYLLAYQNDMSYHKPQAARDLITRINQGALFTFFFGHGDPTAWADESLLRSYSISEVDNDPRYTILGSFACTVGRFDLPGTPSLSMIFLAAPRKGAIASIGAMRESYPIDNQALATKLLEDAIVNGVSTLGTALGNAKGRGYLAYNTNWPYRYNEEKYVLLGEPVLALPQPQASVTLDQKVDTLQALQHVVLSGKVANGAANGKVYLQVLEGPETRTLSQVRSATDTYSAQVEYQGSLIHSEILPYSNGVFKTDFVTPRKIHFGDTAAQIRLWSWTPSEGITGRGLLAKIAIAGTSTYADSIHDTLPPTIRFRPCGFPDSLARNYKSGTTLRLPIPACIEVLITDSTGIDLTEQPDEGVSFEVVGSKDPWHPWPFLEETGKRVVARMDFTDSWKAGTYTFKVNAQDILGNRRADSILVNLTSTIEEGLSGVFNAPNPMGKSGTTFYFRNLADNLNVPDRSKVPVSIEIFNSEGRLVQVIRNAESGITHWDGRDQWGRLLANGLYHYVVTCTVFPSASEQGGKPRRFQAKQKLVISR